ncbi:sporulation protein YpjB [Marinicrinis sediminis]|uniref:Sporulation protein YpjB n=1 Tax=Marinicrinis sediminis TaxID=1652465 RepID=A0ABW5RE07_9BACL
MYPRYLILMCVLFIAAFALLLAACSEEMKINEEKPPLDATEWVKELEQLASQYEQAVQTGKLEQAIVSLNQIERRLEYQPDRFMTLTGRHTLIDLVLKARRSASALKPDMNQVGYHATRLHLALDSLAHPNDPRWKQLKKPILDQIAQLEGQLSSGDGQAKKASFYRLNESYQLLHPVLQVTKEAWVAEKGQSFLIFLAHATGQSGDGVKEKPAHEAVAVLDEFKRFMLDVFEDAELTTAMPMDMHNQTARLWTAFGIASFILAVLTFHAYGRYRYDNQV